MKLIKVKTLARKRFDALAGLSRSPAASYFCEEVAWYSNEDETVIGAICRDFTDDDYSAVAMARDKVGRFRAFRFQVSFATEEAARVWLEGTIKWHTGMGLEVFEQGDEEKKRLDLFTPVLPVERLHPSFVVLSREEAFLPARAIISEMMHHYTDVDGNFVKEFQSEGFDARLWELYLYAYIAEEELFLDRAHAAPDFIVTKYGKTVAIEAVIVGRKKDKPVKLIKEMPESKSPQEIMELLKNEIPILFGSPLYSKLKKAYWNLPHVKGKPLVFAIADFHDDQSMLWTSSGLFEYLYGVHHEFAYDERGQLIISPQKITMHKVKEKEVPSGYFFQPDAQHVSAVLFSASGTISKFNRIGRQAGFYSPRVTMVRIGMHHDNDPNASVPLPFHYTVDESSNETWAEGLSMFHNPNAELPVPEELFPSIAHHHLVRGQIMSHLPPFHPYSSLTLNMRIRQEKA